MAISAVAGAFLGLVAGYYGKFLDGLIMRIIDIMLAFPGILLALVVVAVLGPNLQNVMIAVGISGIPGIADWFVAPSFRRASWTMSMLPALWVRRRARSCSDTSCRM